MLGDYRGNLSLHELYTFWLDCFAMLTIYLKSFSIRATLFREKLRPVVAQMQKTPEGVSAFRATS